MVFWETFANKVQILCYCTSIDVSGIWTFDFFLPTGERKYLNFLLLAFSKQAHYFSLMHDDRFQTQRDE